MHIWLTLCEVKKQKMEDDELMLEQMENVCHFQVVMVVFSYQKTTKYWLWTLSCSNYSYILWLF